MTLLIELVALAAGVAIGAVERQVLRWRIHLNGRARR